MINTDLHRNSPPPPGPSPLQSETSPLALPRLSEYSSLAGRTEAVSQSEITGSEGGCCSDFIALFKRILDWVIGLFSPHSSESQDKPMPSVQSTEGPLAATPSSVSPLASSQTHFASPKNADSSPHSKARPLPPLRTGPITGCGEGGVPFHLPPLKTVLSQPPVVAPKPDAVLLPKNVDSSPHSKACPLPPLRTGPITGCGDGGVPFHLPPLKTVLSQPLVVAPPPVVSLPPVLQGIYPGASERAEWQPPQVPNSSGQASPNHSHALEYAVFPEDKPVEGGCIPELRPWLKTIRHAAKFPCKVVIGFRITDKDNSTVGFAINQFIENQHSFNEIVSNILKWEQTNILGTLDRMSGKANIEYGFFAVHLEKVNNELRMFSVGEIETWKIDPVTGKIACFKPTSFDNKGQGIGLSMLEEFFKYPNVSNLRNLPELLRYSADEIVDATNSTLNKESSTREYEV